MNRLLRLQILCFVLFFQLSVSAQSEWRAAGADDYNMASLGFSQCEKLVVKNGHVYRINREYGRIQEYPYTSASFISLAKFADGRWQHTLTPFDNIQDWEVDNTETPFIALKDAEENLIVKRFNGTEWETLGDEPVSQLSYAYAKIFIDQDDKLVVLVTNVMGALFSLQRFNGTSWDMIPTYGLEDLNISKLSIAPDNTMYIAGQYHDGTSYHAFVKKFSGLSWDEVGITDFQGSAKSLAVDSDQNVYLVTGIGSSEILRKFDGTSWGEMTLPTEYYNASLSNYPLQVKIQDDELYLSYNYEMSYNFRIKKWNGSTWDNFHTYSGYNEPIFTVENGNFYYTSLDSNQMPRVYKKTGSDVILIGEKSDLTDLFLYDNSARITVAENLITASYSDRSNLGKISVKQYHPVNGWTYWGSPAFSDATPRNIEITTASNGAAYVAYINPSYKISVKRKYTNNWQFIGTPEFSLDAEKQLDLKTDNAGTPYIVYKSGRVQKFNGSTWEFVGGSAFTGEKDVQMAFDTSNTPYLIYTELANSSGLTYDPPIVKKLTGTSWVVVGAADLSVFTQSQKPQITFNQSGEIVIAFIDSARNIKTLKWDGSNWLDTGSIDTGGQTTFMKMTADKLGAPNIFYNGSTEEIRRKGSVKRFNGTNWESVGDESFTPCSIYDGGLAFTANNTPVVIYSSDSGMFVRYFGDTNALSSEDFTNGTDTETSLWPNPTSGLIHISPIPGATSLELFDLSGKKLMTSKNLEMIDVSPFQTGIYLLKINTDKGSQTHKIIKN